MPVSVPFTGKSDVTLTCDFLANAAQISADGVRERNFDCPIFKGDAHRVGQLLFSRLCEIDALDLVCAELLRCAFSELSA